MKWYNLIIFLVFLAAGILNVVAGQAPQALLMGFFAGIHTLLFIEGLNDGR